MVREQLLTVLEEGSERSEWGDGYPYYVEKRIRELVSCGDFWRGFSRLRCGLCGHEILGALFVQDARHLPIMQRSADGG